MWKMAVRISTPLICMQCHICTQAEDTEFFCFVVNLKARYAIFKVIFIALKINKETFTSDWKIMKITKLLSSDVQKLLRGNVLEKNKISYYYVAPT